MLELRSEHASSPPLVLLHGLSSCAVDYGPLLKYLRAHPRRLIIPDLPGHGLSQLHGVPDIEAGRRALNEALDRVLDEPAVVFGNSLGGAAGVRFANANPELVKGLILASPGGARVSAEALDALLAQFRPTDLAAARAFIDRISARPHWSHPVLAWAVRHRFEQPGVRELVEMASTKDMLTPEELTQLTMPILLLWGREEKLFGSTEHEFFRTHLPPHALLEEPEGFGHVPFLEHPRAVARRIEQFIRELDAGTD
jgi:pimeloyl-ACP methyl ester carboxylesterase